MANEKRTRRCNGKTFQRKEKDAHEGRAKTAKRKDGKRQKKQVELTQERLKEILFYNSKSGIFIWKEARSYGYSGKIAGGDNGLGYWQITVDGRRYMASRLAWLYVYGKWPDGDVDHRNHQTHDNRLSNLRDGSTSNNCENQIRARSDSKTQLIGAWWSKQANTWTSAIGVRGKKIYLGLFNTPMAAHKAYVSAKRKLHLFNLL